MKILLMYTSYEGQTEKIMLKINEIIGRHFQFDQIKLTSDVKIDLSQYHAVIIGSSIRYGCYHKQIKQFIQTHYVKLNTMYSAFFGVNMIARKPNKNTPYTNTYTYKFLNSISWKPNMKAVFAGALYYPKYNWFDKQMIRFIMWLSKGDTDVSKPVVEYTDWNKVNAFAEQFTDNCLISNQQLV